MSKNDGGPAFPIQPITDSHGRFLVVPNNGMSLRDWFAGQALQELIRRGTSMFDCDIPGAARLAYRVADAMLAERDK